MNINNCIVVGHPSEPVSAAQSLTASFDEELVARASAKSNGHAPSAASTSGTSHQVAAFSIFVKAVVGRRVQAVYQYANGDTVRCGK